MQTLRSQSLVYQQRFAQQQSEFDCAKLRSANELARATAIHNAIGRASKQQADALQSNMQSALAESQPRVDALSRDNAFLQTKEQESIVNLDALKKRHAASTEEKHVETNIKVAALTAERDVSKKRADDAYCEDKHCIQLAV